MTVLLLSDVHANATALSSVLAVEGDIDRVFFLGDAVDCGPQPDSAMDVLRAISTRAVVGNHDRLVLDADTDVTSDSPTERWRQWTRSALSVPNLDYLKSAPRTDVVEIDGHRLRLHHGDFEQPADFDGPWHTRTTPDSSPEVFAAIAERFTEEYILLGHSHLPFVTEVNGTTFVNPGSVGLQRDGWQPDLARYAVFDGARFHLESARYDVATVVDAYDDLPLPAEFRESWKADYRRDAEDD